jgi:hypothetical protein
MDARYRYKKGSRSIGIATVLLYIFHVITHIIMHSKPVRTKEFAQLERKLYIPLLACGTAYLVHNTNDWDWWAPVMIWFVVIFWILSDIACIVASCRKGILFRLFFTLALLFGLIFWFVYWILLANLDDLFN